jgi:ribose-phosphate pyrophosphokinase
MKIFSGTSNKDLSYLISNKLNIPLGEIYHHTFPSGEYYCQFKENIRGCDVFIIQGTRYPANEALMQALIMADAAKRASASRITLVAPHMFYTRQDRKDRSRVPISAKLTMDLIATAGFNRILTMDLHAEQIVGFSNHPVDHLYFQPTLKKALINEDIDVVVAPDIGSVKRAEKIAKSLNKPFAIIRKCRLSDTETEVASFIGDVKDKNVILVDDLTESASTLIEGSLSCKEEGAKKVICAVTHGCFTQVGNSRLVDAFKNNIIDKFYTSNTVDTSHITAQWEDAVGYTDTYTIGSYKNRVNEVDVSEVFATAIERTHNNQSISELF